MQAFFVKCALSSATVFTEPERFFDNHYKTINGACADDRISVSPSVGFFFALHAVLCAAPC
jgi:hypothetical protein